MKNEEGRERGKKVEKEGNAMWWWVWQTSVVAHSTLMYSLISKTGLCFLEKVEIKNENENKCKNENVKFRVFFF